MEKIELLTPEAVAARLSVVRRTLQRWRLTGFGPAYVRLGPRRVAYSRDALEAWIDARSYQSNAAEAARRAARPARPTPRADLRTLLEERPLAP